MTKLLKVVGIFFLAIFLGIIAFSSINWMVRDLAGDYPPLPENLDIAYKEIQVRGMMYATHYVVVDVAGTNHFVTQDKFNELQVIQKIGECLYRTPDGELITK